MKKLSILLMISIKQWWVIYVVVYNRICGFYCYFWDDYFEKVCNNIHFIE